MDGSGGRSLDWRVERLELEVEELGRDLRHLLQVVEEKVEEEDSPIARRRVTDVRDPAAAHALRCGAGVEDESIREGSGPTASGSGEGWRFRRSFGLSDLKELRGGEWWLNKLGIGLVLFGVAFLFLYSVERGWIGPWMRVGFGAMVGALLLAVGLLVYSRRRAFSQVLLGGSVGAFYITGFAAFQLYSLVAYPVAFGYMVAVTLLAFVLSLRQDGVALSLIGALGGLGTPFLLYTDAGNLGGLVLYTCLILAGAGAVYFRKGWVSVLAVSFAGGWAVLLVGYADTFFSLAGASSGERWVLQAGVTFAWLVFWLAPVVRDVLGGRDERRVSTYLLVVLAPLASFGFTVAIWELPSFELGWISLFLTALYAGAALAVRSLGRAVDALHHTHAYVGLFFLTLAALLMLRDDVLLITLAAEAAVLHYVARRFFEGFVSAGAHALFFVVAVWLAARLATATVGSPADTGAFLDVHALVDLLVVGLALAASMVVMPRDLGVVYRVAAHIAVLAWLWRELAPLQGGEAYVTIAWGLYAVGLLVAGLHFDRVWLARGGMATLFLVVGKLFLVDLSEVEALWRVLLFLGFGVLFLSLSYYLRALWRPRQGFAEDPGQEETSGGRA